MPKVTDALRRAGRRVGEALKGVTRRHEERKTLSVDVEIPEHADRTETAIYRRTRADLFHVTPRVIFKADAGRCFICQKTEAELGEPLQSHHFGVERCFAEGDIDWERVKQDFPDFDWASFDPSDPYQFVDDMTAQGLMLCREHHTGKGTGIHDLTFSLWIMQRYLKAGYQYTPTEIIEHAQH